MCDNTISGQGENTIIDSVSRGWVWPSFQWLQSRHELLNLRQPNNTRLEKGKEYATMWKIYHGDVDCVEPRGARSAYPHR